MQTRILPCDPESCRLAAERIRAGEVVAFPTETVYGLGADGCNAEAVLKIFEAKERPADNPLIYHIYALQQWEELVPYVPDEAAALAEAFWPGPLTIILPARTDVVPSVGRAGLETVGVRMPDHPDARAFLRACGVPVAAPSANRSGRPSPTRAEDVYEDMKGRIPLILDGGSSRVGVESTVVSVQDGIVRILRPGGVTEDMIASVVPHVEVHAAALAPVPQGTKAPSPGMLHRHYAPKAQVFLAGGSPEEQSEALRRAYDACPGRACIFATAQNLASYGERGCYLWGDRDSPATLAESLFTLLRRADAEGYEYIYAETVEPRGMGLAVMNRLLRAAEFRYLPPCFPD